MKYYCGVGSRETPDRVLFSMDRFAREANRAGLWLRSGAALGADSAFEDGCDCEDDNDPDKLPLPSKKEIYLPWMGYNDSQSTLYRIPKEAFTIVGTIHPYFAGMKQGSQKLIARNVLQVLGETLDNPVEFVICWTKDGCEDHKTYTPATTGGTGIAIALASKLNIPVYNLNNPQRLEAAYNHLIKLKLEHEEEEYALLRARDGDTGFSY